MPALACCTQPTSAVGKCRRQACRQTQPIRAAVTLLCTCTMCSSLLVAAVPIGFTAVEQFPPSTSNDVLGAMASFTDSEGGALSNSGEMHAHASVQIEQMAANRQNPTDGNTVSTSGDDLVSLKVLAMLAITLASLAGVLPPILGWSNGLVQGKEPRHFFWLRSFSAGIMLSLALIHIIAEAFELMDGLCGDFPIAAVFVLVGVFGMLIIERISMDILARSDPEGGAAQGCVFQCGEPGRMHLLGETLSSGGHATSASRHASESAAACLAHTAPEPVIVEQKEDPLHVGVGPFHSQTLQQHKPLGENNPSVAEDLLTPSTVAEAEAEAEQEVQMARKKAVLNLSLLEGGIVVHSLIIGLNMGVMSDDPSALFGLTVALCFHQLFEGIGVGACIAAVSMHLRARSIVLAVCTFVCTMPLGTVLGLVLLQCSGAGPGGGYDAHSSAQLWLRGALDGVSGGILLFVALVHFIAEDMSRVDLNQRCHFWLRWQMMGCLFAGAATMAVLAVWA